MRVTLVTVEFKKTVNDGNYGNESAQCQLTAELGDIENSMPIITALQQEARDRVMAQLTASNNLQVRRNTNPRPRLCNRCHLPLSDETNVYLHPECSDLERAERDAERLRQQQQDNPAGPADESDDSLPWEEREPLAEHNAAVAAARDIDDPF